MAELLVATGSGTDSGVAGGGSAFSFSLSSVFFSASSFLFSTFSPLFSLSSPFCSLSLGPLFFFFSAALPCIYRKTGEGERVGAAIVGRPLHYLQRITTPGKWVNCGCLIAPKPGKKVGEKRRKKLFFSPVLCASRGRRRWCRFKTAPFYGFFFVFIIFCGDPKMGYNSYLIAYRITQILQKHAYQNIS